MLILFSECSGLLQTTLILLGILYNGNHLLLLGGSFEILTPKAPITIAADKNFATSFLIFEKNMKGMLFHENLLLADDSRETSYLICYF